jgi:hypothetical protein
VRRECIVKWVALLISMESDVSLLMLGSRIVDKARQRVELEVAGVDRLQRRRKLRVEGGGEAEEWRRRSWRW